MAYLTRETYTSVTIPKMKDQSGKMTSDPKCINNIFKTFYQTLYSKPKDDEETITHLNSGKAPGPDGFTTEYYKGMKRELPDSNMLNVDK